MAEQKNKLSWNIKTKEDALQIIKVTSIAFYFVGGIQILFGVIAGIQLIIEGAILIILAFLLSKFNSRIVSILLLLTACIILFTIHKNITNLFLVFIMLWVSIMSCRATFKLPKLN